MGSSFQLKEIKNKIKENNLEKYGCEYYQQTDDFKNKFINTCLDKYGVTNPMQIFEIHEKQQDSGYKLESYNGVKYRGTYELDFIKFCEKSGIKLSNPSKILYDINGKYHYYFPDFYIEKYNLICEVKSNYYYKICEDRNLKKMKSSLELGYNFLFILDKNYSDLEKIINYNGNTII